MENYINVDKSRFEDSIKAYFLWKELNSLIKNSHNRGVNFPETISETLCCYAMGWLLKKGKGAGTGDAYDPVNDEIIEIKATSNWERDTTSFSPIEIFDNLYFLRLNYRNDELYIYNIEMDSESLKQIKVNKRETVFDQQRQKRRPRFSIIKNLIEKDNIVPIKKIDLRKEKVILL